MHIVLFEFLEKVICLCLNYFVISMSYYSYINLGYQQGMEDSFLHRSWCFICWLAHLRSIGSCS